MEPRHRKRIPVRGLLLAALILVTGPSACATPPAPTGAQANLPPCRYQKVGEVREVTRAEIRRAMRSMGGDFVMSRVAIREDRVTLYDAEIFRYEEGDCRRRR